LALSTFDDKVSIPKPKDLEAALGLSALLWERLVAGVARDHAPIEEAWSFAGAKFGWSLRLKHKDRIVLYLIPQTGHFLVGVVLGEKAVQAAHEHSLPGPVLDLIDNARPYAEGRGIRFPVTTPEDVDAALTLATVKMAR